MALAATGGAGDCFGASGGSCAFALGAGHGPTDGDLFFASADCFEEIDFEIVAQIGSLIGARGATTVSSSESALENISEDTGSASTRIKNFTKNIKGVVEASASASASRSWGEGAMAVAIVGWAFLWIGKNLVGFSNFLEFFFGFFISLMFVGMMLDGEFAVGLFNLLGGDGARNAEDFVVIFFGGHGLGGWGRGGSDRDDTGGTEEAIPNFVATTALMEDKAFGFSWGGFLAKSFVPVGVEGFAEGIDGGDSVIGEEAIELALD